MNYIRVYWSIIHNRLDNKVDGYVEHHHIVPKSEGGTDNNDNIVALTAREHYICHLLLAKIYNDYKMLSAVVFMQSKTNFICGPWYTSNDLSAPCIHHYFTKTLDEWNFRRGYGRADTDPNSNMFKRTINEFYEHNFNEVENTELS